jgi:hypothetical protein
MITITLITPDTNEDLVEGDAENLLGMDFRTLPPVGSLLGSCLSLHLQQRTIASVKLGKLITSVLLVRRKGLNCLLLIHKQLVI